MLCIFVLHVLMYSLARMGVNLPLAVGGSDERKKRRTKEGKRNGSKQEREHCRF